MRRRLLVAAPLGVGAGWLFPTMKVQATASDISVTYKGMHSDIVQISSQDGDYVQHLAMNEKLREVKMSPNNSVVAVRCGWNNNGDGVLLFGLWYKGNRMYCDGVVRFVPADDTLQLYEPTDEAGGGATVQVRTGKNKDVCTSFTYDGDGWLATTEWYRGFVPATNPIPRGGSIYTKPSNLDPHYVASYSPLNPP